MVKPPEKSSKYGTAIWVDYHTKRELDEILVKGEQNEIGLYPGNIIKRLLMLRKTPQFITSKMRQTEDPFVKEIYSEILEHILNEKKRIERDDP